MNPDTASHPQDFKTANTSKLVLVHHEDLPIHCPREDESLWNSHPCVYIPVEENGGRARCIYCSTVYELVD